MKKQHTIYLVTSIATLILITGGWYTYKFRECIEKVSYVPPREQGVQVNTGYISALNPAKDKGDYYLFFPQKFKTSDDAMRACIWK